MKTSDRAWKRDVSNYHARDGLVSRVVGQVRFQPMRLPLHIERTRKRDIGFPFLRPRPLTNPLNIIGSMHDETDEDYFWQSVLRHDCTIVIVTLTRGGSRYRGEAAVQVSHFCHSMLDRLPCRCRSRQESRLQSVRCSGPQFTSFDEGMNHLEWMPPQADDSGR